MRRTRMLIVLLIGLLLLLPACSQSGPARREPPSSKVQAGGDITTVVIGLVPWDDTPALNELIRVFQEQHPSIRIQKRMLKDGNDADPVLRNKQVDLVSATMVRTLSKVRLLQPLDPYIERSKLDWKAMGRMDELQIDGRIYDLPYFLSPFLLLYNEELCQAAGTGTPTKSWTWDDLRFAAKKAAHGQGQDRVWGYALDSGFWWEYELYVLGQTPDLRWWANGPAVMRGLQYFGGMSQTDGSAPRLPATERGPDTDIDPSLLPGPGYGNAAFAISQLDSLTGLDRSEQPGVTVGVAPTPLTPGAPPIMGARPKTLAMAAGSPVPEAAWSFLEFIGGPEGAEIVARLGYMPAYRTPELMQLWLQHKPAHSVDLDALIDRAVRLIKDDDATATPQQTGVVRGAARDAFTGKLTPEEAYGRYVDALPK